MGFRQAVRAAAMALLESYKDANDDALRQIYPGRPMSIFPPCAFVDAINEPDIGRTGPHPLIQRTPQVEIRIVQGDFDSADTVEGQDELVDGFIAHVLDINNRHAAGENTLIEVVSVADEPGWVPEWMPPEHRRSYYSTVITLEGTSLSI